MKRFLLCLSRSTGLIWLCVLSGATIAGAAVALMIQHAWQDEQLSMLQTSVERASNELMSQTISGTLIGALSLSGIINNEIKSESLNPVFPNTPATDHLFRTIAQIFDTDGVFVASSDGVIRASWNSGDKPSTGLDIRFRPYFQVAMQGRETIYAAVSLAQKRRSVYFAAPIFVTSDKDSGCLGVIVARTSLSRIDRALAAIPHAALLVSPQRLVFASNRPEWVSTLIAEPTPERISEIRERKQFGDLFVSDIPTKMAIPTQNGIGRFAGKDHAFVSASLAWNDSEGDWQLLLMQDLDKTYPIERITASAASSGALAGIIVWLLLNLLRSHFRQQEASQKIQELAQAQEAHARQKEGIATLSLKLQKSDSTEALGQYFLSEAHTLLGTLQGVLYAKEADGGLRLIASYACETQPPARLEVGEGLVGQCALQQSRIVLDATTETRWHIHSGLGEARPACTIICPIELNESLVGVLEIALSEPPGDDQEICIETMLPMLAMNLEIKSRHEAGNAPGQQASRHMEDSA
ncbi:GAF domain-containing protein [uncultured Propionivibrio sp.]|uniref:GAF domain-containing protein n=1 Tax=uncultured Propionivibrio sp. TaxID=426737 RepID=UPI0029C0D370|nr:GAF domain-containing protein [uncultured Propionivibrio sp.]